MLEGIETPHPDLILLLEWLESLAALKLL